MQIYWLPEFFVLKYYTWLAIHVLFILPTIASFSSAL